MRLAFDLYWIACFAIALFYALRLRKRSVEDRDEMLSEKVNGVALIEVRSVIRRAIFRIAISSVMAAAGLGGLVAPATAWWEAVRLIVFTLGFMVFATVYAVQGFLEDRDRDRTLELLKK